jgi:hypothetical protein
VHSKATTVTFDTEKANRLEIKGKIPDQVTLEDAKKGLEIVEGLMQALRGIDSQASDAWLIDYDIG